MEWKKSSKSNAAKFESDGDDSDLNDIDKSLKLQSEAVVNTRKKEGVSIGYLKEVTKLMSLMNGRVANGILGCKEDLLGGEKSFNLAVQEFFKFNQQLLDFCSALDKFVKSTRDTHSYMQFVVQQYFDNKMDTEYCKKILLKLKNLKSSDDEHAQTAESLLKRVDDLVREFNIVLATLKSEIEKIGMQQKRLQSRKNLSKILYGCSVVCTSISLFGIVGADLVPDIISAATDQIASNASVVVDQSHLSAFMDAHPDLAQTIADNPHATSVSAHAGVIAIAGAQTSAGRLVINTIFEGKENALKDRMKKLESAAKESQLSILELGDIKARIDKVVIEIDSLMRKTSIAVKMGDVDFLMMDIKKTLETFMKKIDDLDIEAAKCSDETLKARNAVRDRIKT